MDGNGMFWHLIGRAPVPKRAESSLIVQTQEDEYWVWKDFTPLHLTWWPKPDAWHQGFKNPSVRCFFSPGFLLLNDQSFHPGVASGLEKDVWVWSWWSSCTPDGYCWLPMLFIKHFLFGWWAHNVSESFFHLRWWFSMIVLFLKGPKPPTNQPSIASVNDSLTQHVAHWWQMATVWLHVPPCIGVVCGPPPSQWKKWFPMVWVNECKWSMMLPSIIHSTFLRKATTPLQKQKQAGKYRYQKRKKHISHHLSNYLLNSPCLMVLKC